MTEAIDMSRMQRIAELKTTSKYGISNPTQAQEVEPIDFGTAAVASVLTDTNLCTDGKDDGHIGLGSAILNTVEGVAKVGINLVKGLLGFQKKADGTMGWSLGTAIKNIAITAGSIALCVACPAAGVGLAAVGLATGGVELVKGVVNVCQAKTDADKKTAFENIGTNATQVVLSIFGMKAGVKAVKKTSTAGKLGGSALDELKSTGKKFRTDSVEYAKAFLKDCKSSTSNNFGKLAKSAALRRVKQAEVAETDAKNYLDELNKSDVDMDGGGADWMNSAESSYDVAAENLKTTAQNLADTQAAYDKASMLGKGRMALKGARQYLSDSAKSGIKSSVHKLGASAKAAKQAGVKATAQKGAGTVASAASKVGSYIKTKATGIFKGIKHPIKTTKAFVNKLLSESSGANTLDKSKAEALFKFLSDPKKSVNQAIQQFGYENVQDALVIANELEILNEEL